NNDIVPPRPILFIEKCPPAHRSHSEQGKEIRRHDRARNALRRISAREVVIIRFERRELLEGLRLTPIINKLGGGNRNLVKPLFESLPNKNETFRVFVWQRFEQHSIDDTENRRIPPDAER